MPVTKPRVAVNGEGTRGGFFHYQAFDPDVPLRALVRQAKYGPNRVQAQVDLWQRFKCHLPLIAAVTGWWPPGASRG